MSETIETAKIRMMLRFPFFASITCRRPLREDNSIETMGVDGKGQIYYNPDFAETIGVDGAAFVLAHEAMHVVFAHAWRRGDRDHELWNIAADACINNLLLKSGIGCMPKGGVDFSHRSWGPFTISKDIDSYSAEELYAELLSQREDGKDSLPDEWKDLPDDPSESNSDGGGDDKSEPNSGQGASSKHMTAERAIADGKRELAEARQLERMAGRGSSHVIKALDVYLDEKIPWYTILERLMVAKAESHQTWSRPNRRKMNVAYLPRRERASVAGELVIGIDCSGSIGDEECAEFMSHVNAIIQQIHPTSVHVLYTTDSVEKEETFDSWDYPVTVSPERPCGGTDMRAILNWIEENDIDACGCVIFTDGYTPYPKPGDAPCDVWWVLNTDYTPPEGIGEVLHVK